MATRFLVGVMLVGAVAVWPCAALAQPYPTRPARNRNQRPVPQPEPPATGALALSLGGPGADYGKDVAIDRRGNILLTGYFTQSADLDPTEGQHIVTSAGSSDIFLLKLSPAGVLQWIVTLGGAGADMPSALTTDADGNILLTGYYSGIVNFAPGEAHDGRRAVGQRDAFIAKYTPRGTLAWTVTFGSPGEDEGLAIAVDELGHVVASGVVSGPVALNPEQPQLMFAGGGGEDAFIAAYSPEGRFEWGSVFGGPGPDQADAVAFASRNEIYVSGVFSGNVDFDAGRGSFPVRSAGKRDAFVARFAGPRPVWVTPFGGRGDDYAAPGGLCVRPDGTVLFTGRFPGRVRFGDVQLSSAGEDDGFVAEVRRDGTPLNAISFGGAGEDGGYRVRLDARGQCIVTGAFAGTANFASAPERALLSARAANGVTDAFVAKYDTRLRLQWAAGYGGALADRGPGRIPDGGVAAGLALDADDRILVTGRYYERAVLYGSGAGLERKSAGVADCFLLRLSPQGTP